jgi:hypothetical protein
MTSKIKSLIERIKAAERDLQLILERESWYPVPAERPLALEKAKREKEKELRTLRKRLQQYEMISGPVARRRPIPGLLVYLPDRDAQDTSFAEVLRVHRQGPPRILLCLVHGAEFECHDMFVERIRNYSLPKLLGLASDIPSVVAHYLEWPTTCRSGATLHTGLRRRLSEMISGHSESTADEIHRALAADPGRTLIHTHVLADQIQFYGRSAISDFIRFWQHWPRPAEGQLLLVFLLVKYRSGQGLGGLRKVWLRLSNWVTARQIEKLKHVQFDGLNVVALPRLRAVSRQDAENWARLDCTRLFCRTQDMLAEIRNIFEAYTAASNERDIPLEFLSRELKAALYKHMG